MNFEQATIKVDKEAEFAELKGAIGRVFHASAERFLKELRGSHLRVRDFDAVLSKRILEVVDVTFSKSGKTAESLYQALSMSDQAQMREFYLSQLEEVQPELRTKFQKLYQYY